MRPATPCMDGSNFRETVGCCSPFFGVSDRNGCLCTCGVRDFFDVSESWDFVEPFADLFRRSCMTISCARSSSILRCVARCSICNLKSSSLSSDDSYWVTVPGSAGCTPGSPPTGRPGGGEAGWCCITGVSRSRGRLDNGVVLIAPRGA